MPLGRFLNDTIANASCTAPLLDQSLFGSTGGYQPGRYCGLGSFEDGTTCCFPCPIQDWVYPPDWDDQLRVPNYLSILSVVLCLFLLLSFAILPPEKTHRHYLSVGLLFPVLFISLSFVIPVGIEPKICYDAITPNDMRGSTSFAWTGSLVTLGGLGCVVWVFLRSLWLHIRIFWDRDPGSKFKWASIITGTLLPLLFLIAILAATGFSYRMGQTCLPNHEHAIVTFWIWLVIFSIAAFLLQFVTTGYCFYVYIRTWKKHRRERSLNSFENQQQRSRFDTWRSVRKLFLLQWRNILVSLFTIIGSISFFIVFWTQDSKIGHVFNDLENIKPVKTWIICQTLSRGDKQECRKYVKNFTVPLATILISLVLASLIGIEIFVLLFRRSIFYAWRDLLYDLLHRARGSRPPTPELTTFENPDKYLPSTTTSSSSPKFKRPPLVSIFSNTPSESYASEDFQTSSTSHGPVDELAITPAANQTPHPPPRPFPERLTSETALLSQTYPSFFDNTSTPSLSLSPSITPLPSPPPQTLNPVTATSPLGTASPVQVSSPLHVASQASTFHPTRDVPPTPTSPPRTLSRASASVSPTATSTTVSKHAQAHAVKPSFSRPFSAVTRPSMRAAAVGNRVISTPVPGSFMHVNGAFLERRSPGREAFGERDGQGVWRGL